MEQFFKGVAEDLAEDLGVKVKDGEEEEFFHPYAHLEKAHVLQEARIFHDTEIVRRKPRKCCTLLAQILYIQNDSKSTSRLTQVEATDLFFAATKLFVSSDPSLRRLVYLFIKEIIPLCDPSDVIIVTSCLTKDMTSNRGLYRANAIRVLVDIIDSSMLTSIERYIKQAIVDNDPHVSNSALVAASHWFTRSDENKVIIKRWIGEVHEALVRQTSIRQDMVQMNAMRLLIQMKGHDRLGISKLVQQFSGKAGKGLKSPLALVILIRACGKLIQEEISNVSWLGDIREVSSLCRLGFDFLEASLSHSIHMVSFEAARTISSFHNLEPQNLLKTIECYQRMLISEMIVIRFAAVKSLSETANHHPRAVARCNEGLEKCLEDDNTQVATMAVTTLLKTGSEQILDRLVSKLDDMIEHMSDDEIKIALVISLRDLCIRYPSKYEIILKSMATFLSNEGTFKFKHSIVKSISSLMQQYPDTTKLSLMHLCEYIEDCEYSMLSTKIMHIVAKLGPSTRSPSCYIRFLYSRLMLENATVRAAAVTSLSAFASSCPSLRVSILALLQYSLMDENDEVRERSAVAARLLERAMKDNPYKNPDPDANFDELPPDVPVDGDLAAFVFSTSLPMSFDKLKRSIDAYTTIPGAMESAETLTFSCLPVMEDARSDEANATDNLMADGGHSGTNLIGSNKVTVDPAAAIYAVPELAEFGIVFKTSQSIALTEDETEYVVRCTKHILEEHVILQFSIHNTVETQKMEHAAVSVDLDSDLFEIIGVIPADTISYGNTSNCFCLLRRASHQILPVTLSCQLNFLAIEVDPDTNETLSNGYQEEYPLEDLTIAPSDLMTRTSVADFKEEWNRSLSGNEVKQKFMMQYDDVGKAATELIDTLGMMPCDSTQEVRNRTKHMLHLSGIFIGGHKVLARADFLLQKDGVVVKIAVRSDDKSISQSLVDCIG